MSDVEHWREYLARNTAPECKAQAVCVNGRHCIDAGRCLRSGEVAVVPASQLARAVRLLREAQAHMDWLPDTPVGRRARWAADVDALDRTGGQ